MVNRKAVGISEKIEPFLRSSINSKNLNIRKMYAQELLTWNRFDLGFKLFYLDIRNKNAGLARNVYEQHLRSFGLGKILEPGNSKKNSGLIQRISNLGMRKARSHAHTHTHTLTGITGISQITQSRQITEK
jgi:hypothetical protein